MPTGAKLQRRVDKVVIYGWSPLPEISCFPRIRAARAPDSDAVRSGKVGWVVSYMSQLKHLNILGRRALHFHGGPEIAEVHRNWTGPK